MNYNEIITTEMLIDVNQGMDFPTFADKYLEVLGLDEIERVYDIISGTNGYLQRIIWFIYNTYLERLQGEKEDTDIYMYYIEPLLQEGYEMPKVEDTKVWSGGLRWLASALNGGLCDLLGGKWKVESYLNSLEHLLSEEQERNPNVLHPIDELGMIFLMDLTLITGEVKRGADPYLWIPYDLELRPTIIPENLRKYILEEMIAKVQSDFLFIGYIIEICLDWARSKKSKEEKAPVKEIVSTRKYQLLGHDSPNEKILDGVITSISKPINIFKNYYYSDEEVVEFLNSLFYLLEDDRDNKEELVNSFRSKYRKKLASDTDRVIGKALEVI